MRARATWLFFAIAFGGAWAGWITQAVLHVTQPHALAWALTYASGDCCALAGFVAVYSARGWPGVRHLLRRCTRWRVPVRWWMYVLGLPTVWGALAAIAYGVGTGHLLPVYPLKLALLLTPTYLFWFVTGPLVRKPGGVGFCCRGFSSDSRRSRRASSSE